jgi:hypothetical protein
LRPNPPRDLAPEEVKQTVVVRRGLSASYYFFLEVFAKQNNVKLVVDRRSSERRHLPREVPIDQRRADRRSDSEPRWVARDDFFVVRSEIGTTGF